MIKDFNNPKCLADHLSISYTMKPQMHYNDISDGKSSPSEDTDNIVKIHLIIDHASTFCFRLVLSRLTDIHMHIFYQ